MAQSLAGKVAIVTGGSRGLGAGIAKELASKGAQVMITYRSAAEKATEVVEGIKKNGGLAAMVQVDCMERSSPQRVVDATLEAFNAGIDIVVNNAGSPPIEVPLTELTYEQYDEIFNVFLRFPIFMVQAALPHMKRGGKIVNIGSQASRIGWPGYTLYCAVKAGVESLTRTWHVEFGRSKGITTTTINLGATETDGYQDPRRTNGAVGLLPDVFTVDEVAETVRHVCETQSRLFEGSVLIADLYDYSGTAESVT